MKILGVIFQQNGLFTKHVKSLLAQAQSLLYLLKDLRHNQMAMDEVNRLFEAVILSQIRYGISVYGCDDGALRKVDKFLGKCYDKRYCKDRFCAYGLLEKEDRRLLQQVMSNETHPLHQYIMSH